MTKEKNIATLNEHLEHWKRLLSEKICDQSEGEKTIDALQNAIKALEQEHCDDVCEWFEQYVDIVTDIVEFRFSDGTVKRAKRGLYLSDIEKSIRKMLIDQIANEKKQEPKWIPISERLPEEAGMYLCSYDDDDIATSYFDIRMNEFNMLHEQVTAWMYIPEPYQPKIPTGAEGSDKK